MTPIQQISKLLRTPENVLLKLEQKMNALTGKAGIFEKIYQENQIEIEERLKELGVNKKDAKSVYSALIKKVTHSDKIFFELFGKPEFSTAAGCGKVVNLVKDAADLKKGFFLSFDRAKELLKLNPPLNILKFLKYKNVDEMLVKEDILEVFSALRFAEEASWLNDVFFRPYNDLKEGDFEEREIKVKVLSEKWLKIGSKFTGKKLHNISHLKELGVIFVIPVKERFVGQTMELFTLILHYFHEIDFYAQIFRNYAKTEDFGRKMISALKGEVGGLPMEDGQSMNWRIVQRYLAKDDPNDPRLFEPHVNPEARHWIKAERNIAVLGQKFPGLDFSFWDGMDHVGEYFPLNNYKNGEMLVSFDLIDNVISLSKKTTVLSKYLYHQQEALWNRIFIEYAGEEKLEELLRENLAKGYINLG